jgi:arylsulfatase A-like enzyme
MPADAETDPPNVLYIMADDHAANAIGAYGSHLANVAPTDNIDRLAHEGARLDNCLCTNSICTPSRAAILTGQHSHENGVRTLSDEMDNDRRHLAHHLQDAGYRTGVIGKWHLRTAPQGFDYYNVLPGQGRYDDPILHESGDWDGEGQVYEGHSTDVITDQALAWLEGEVGDGAGHDDDPFFLQCHFKAPHGGWLYPERFADLFEGKTIPEPSSLFEDKSHRSAATRDRGSTISSKNSFRTMVEQLENGDYGREGPLDTEGMTEDERTRAAYQRHLEDYLRTVAGIDENVGRLLGYLDEAGLAENTLVIYTSDQGEFLGEHDHWDKRWMYEEPFRMPFIARYPGEIPADSFVEDLVANVDFAPTILDYAGVDIPDRMHGRSVRENLAGDPDAESRDAVYYRYWMHRAHHDVPAHYGLRTDRYALMFFYGLPLDAAGASEDRSTPGWELYDLQRDPHELNNVYDDPAYADVRQDLKERLAERKQAIGDTDDQYPELVELKEEHW